MTISELIKVLSSIEDEHGDVPVENSRGTEIFSVAHVFEPPSKGASDPSAERKTIAVTIQ